MLDSKANWEGYSNRVHIYDSIVPDQLKKILSFQSNVIEQLGDVGCGDGVLLLALKNEGLLKNRIAYGIDLSQERLQRLQKQTPEIMTIQCSAEDLKLADQSFDLMISTQVIEHVEDQNKMIQELHRVLKPGGKLYLSTVFKKWYGWYFYRCNGKWALDPTHLREYQSDQELLPEIEKQGFRILQQNKEAIAYPLVDPLLRRLKIDRSESGTYSYIRRLKIPIPGYFNWEIIAERL